MFSFLILLPLTLISVAIGLALVTTPQVAEYVEYLSKLGLNQEPGRLRLQVAAHILTYGLMCFVLAATVRTVSAPLSPDRRTILKHLQLILEGTFVSVPSVVLIILSVKALRSDWSNGILWLGVAMATVGLVATVLATLTRRPCDFFRSTFRPFSITKTDLLGGIAFATGIALFVSFLISPVESATFLGIFPVLFLAFTTAHLIVAAIFARGSSPIAILSTVVSAVVILQFIDSALTTREFRHTSVLTRADVDVKPEALLERRQILELEPAFRRWLEHRRPAIEAYRKKGKTYPVFFVAAQGGGIYAAYHSALSLAHLHRACPEFAHHLFAISAVSGGGLGSAVFTELLRSLPAGPASDPSRVSEGCSSQVGSTTLEEKVETFFKANFLSPVVASAFVFDLPGLLVPQLRFGLDRAMALEYAFEAAWRKAGFSGTEPYGLAKDFYGRWQPEGLAPALFLSTTGVNHGIPVLVSQINWSRGSRRSLSFYRLRARQLGQSALVGNEVPAEIVALLREKVEQRDGRSRISVVGNILDFRPDLRLATSTAVLLSARFPYVTPPASIRREKRLKDVGGLFKDIEVLELMDGGMFDNSAGRVATDLLHSLELDLELSPEFKDFKDDIRFHLIQFTDRDAQRHGGASVRGHFELATPLVAFNAVRLARGAEKIELRGLKKTSRHSIHLADEWFEPTLNWLLTENTKRNIEARSGVMRSTIDPICCRVTFPDEGRFLRLRGLVDEIGLDEEQQQKLRALDAAIGVKVERFIPNDRAFRRLIELVNVGDRRPNPVAAK